MIDLFPVMKKGPGVVLPLFRLEFRPFHGETIRAGVKVFDQSRVGTKPSVLVPRIPMVGGLARNLPLPDMARDFPIPPVAVDVVPFDLVSGGGHAPTEIVRKPYERGRWARIHRTAHRHEGPEYEWRPNSPQGIPPYSLEQNHFNAQMSITI